MSESSPRPVARTWRRWREATVSTAAVMAAGPERISVTVDRPFNFLMRDDATGTLRFEGRVTEP